MNNSKEYYEKTYASILKFYDFAESLIATVEDARVKDPIAQLEFVEPIINQLEEATDLLAEEYRSFVRTDQKPGVFAKKRIEKALAKVMASIELCKNQGKVTKVIDL
jgi:hypothetical protein